MFSLTDSVSRTVQDAKEGKTLKVLGKKDHRWIVDGDKVVFEEMVDPKWFKDAFKDLKSGRNTSAAPLPHKYLANGKYDLGYDPAFLNVINVYTADDPGPKPFDETPRSMSVRADEEFSPEKLLQKFADKQMTIAAFPREKWNGLTLTVFGYAMKDDTKWKKYYFDPEHGHLIRRVTFVDMKSQETTIEIAVTDVIESKGRWFPKRWLCFISIPLGGTGHFRWKELVVTEFDAEKRPDDSEFTITANAGTQVVNPADLTSSFRLKQNETIHIDQIETLVKMAKEAKNNPLMDTAIPPPPSQIRRQWYIRIGIGLGALLLSGAGFWWYRHRKHRSNGVIPATDSPAIPPKTE
jgi:hypothetical protein